MVASYKTEQIRNIAIVGHAGSGKTTLLKILAKNDKEIKIHNNKESLKTLWECCQIPDFSKKAYGNHIDVVKKVFEFLTSKSRKVTNDYMKKQLQYLDRYDGNIDTLTNRISNVRTWSYVANKKNWTSNADYWVERTKYIEDNNLYKNGQNN